MKRPNRDKDYRLNPSGYTDALEKYTTWLEGEQKVTVAADNTRPSQSIEVKVLELIRNRIKQTEEKRAKKLGYYLIVDTVDIVALKELHNEILETEL